MTQKEKARAYDEALERCKKVHLDCTDEERKVVDYIFPELRESEDEKIRKEMIHWLKGFIGEEEDCGYTEDEIRERIAYLEKQKEKKLAESAALQKAFISSKTDYTLKEKCDASDYADAILPTSVADGENEEEYKLHKIIEAAFIAGQKKEQKPAEWSKEDEKIYQSIMDDTVQENQLNDKQTNWLRDIKYRYFPQPSWKPSEEQMEALARATNRCVGVDDAKRLVKLLERLEKL